MTIWANCIVNNEENFVWFAIMSVVDFVDKVLVYDTGSTDKTVEVIRKIREIKGGKVELRQVGEVNGLEFTKMRQKMLEQSRCDWILVLDGDEIWWENSIKMIKDEIEKYGDKLDAIIVPFYNLVGDIYHCQSQDAGKYEIAGRKGHLTIRALNRNIPGLHLAGPYGEEAFVDGQDRPIQQRDLKKLRFIDAPFMHFTHLKRSSKNGHGKFKYDLGLKANRDFQFPEVFYLKKPAIVPSPWQARSRLYELVSLSKRILKHD